MSGLQLSDLALPDQSWNVWSETMVVQAELNYMSDLRLLRLSLHVWSLWLSGLGSNVPRGAVLCEAVGSELGCPVRGCPV